MWQKIRTKKKTKNKVRKQIKLIRINTCFFDNCAGNLITISQINCPISEITAKVLLAFILSWMTQQQSDYWNNSSHKHN
jgi:hypothetical protein